MTVPLDAAQESRFQGLVEEVTMVDVHQHPFVLPEDMGLFIDYLRTNSYSWGYEAVKHGGWSAVTTANIFRGLVNARDMSFIEYDDVLAEVSMMLADLNLQQDVVKVGNANDIEAAKQQGKVGFLPTLEHLAIGYQLDRVDTLYNVGVRLAGLTYFRKNYIGDGMYERNDGGLRE
jgi:membrane dipeptidase